MTENPAAILRAVNASFGFATRPEFLRGVRLEIHRGACVGIVGPNGAGKSTLLRLLAGLLVPRTGAIELEGRPLGALHLRERARRVAFLPQHAPRDLPHSAGRIVLMGRFPHRRFGLFESPEDIAIAEAAMKLTHTSAFADRPMTSLSGGEAQRVHLAAALAQRPEVLLLDEPTTALDLFHQFAVFELLRGLATGQRLAVVVVTHDLNLAARYCTHVLLLNDGRPEAFGPPEDVLTPKRLESVYRVRVCRAGVTGHAGEWLVPLPAASATDATSGEAS